MRLRRAALLLLAALTPPLAVSQSELPDLGSSALTVLPIDKELALGEAIMQQMRGHSPVIDDPLLDEYLNELGNKLVANAEDVNFPFQFFWVNDPEINAFAFYGGHVGVHTAIISQADSESELASVLGHEISHVTQRHLARRLKQQQDNQPLTIASMIASIFVIAANPEAGMAVLGASSTQSMLAQTAHSRQAEQEADRIGMSTLVKSGFDARASATFLGRLQARYRNVNKPPVFLMTHPLPDSRVSDTRLRAQQYPELSVASSDGFQFSKMRVMVRYQYDAKGAEAQIRKLMQGPNFGKERFFNYGLALSFIDQKKIDDGLAILLPLWQQEPRNLFYLDALTDAYVAKRDFTTILPILEQAYLNAPNNQVVTLNYANAALQSGDSALAIKLLKYFLLHKPEHVLAYQLLTEAYQTAGDKAKFHETRGQLYAMNGAYMQGIQELDRALNHLGDKQHVDIQRVEALQKQYRQAQQELKRL